MSSVTAGPPTGTAAQMPPEVADGPPPPAVDVAARGTGRLRGALAWSYAFSTGGTVVNALLQVGVTAILSPHNFGIMVLAMVWVTLALMLLAHGPTQAVIQQDGLTEEHFNAAFWVTMAGATGYTLLFVAAAPLWAAVNHVPDLVPVCLALAPVIPMSAFVAIPDAVIRRRMQMRSIALRGLTCAVVSGAVGLGCAIGGLGVWSLVAQQLTTYALYVVLLWQVTPWKPHRPRLHPTMAAIRDLRSSSVQTLSGSLGYFVSSRVDGLLMGMFFAPAVIGHYRFASRFAEMVSDVTSGGLGQVSLPELARHNADRKKLAEQLGRLIHIAAVLTFPALAILAAVAAPFVHVIGRQWDEAVVPLRVMCVVSAVGAISQLLAPALQAAQRPGIPAIFTWLGAGLSVASFLVAIRMTRGDSGVHRLVVVALAVLAMQAVLCAALVYVAYHRILQVSVGPTLAAMVPAVLASVGGFAAGWWLAGRLRSAAALPALVGSGSGGVLVAGVVLLLVDRSVRAGAVTLLRRLPVARRLPGFRERRGPAPIAPVLSDGEV